MRDPAAVPDEWIDGLRDALGVFGALVVEPAVVESWSTPSALPGYTVGGIAGHVLSLIVGMEKRIESGTRDADAIPYTQWYGGALSGTAVDSRLISAGEELAAAGPKEVAASFVKAKERLPRFLRRTPRDFVVPLASVPGSGVVLTDFVRTRFVEIAVHGNDIAVSVGLPRPAFPPIAWTVAAEVVAETTRAHGAGADFVITMSRAASYEPAVPRRR
jgi:uncharacterized protein (TIGR03083 family)